jgi:glycosyltransferase involved in cell wall biosynthesis
MRGLTAEISGDPYFQKRDEDQMPAPQIVGIVLIKNEDLQIERVLRNIASFCDRIIVTDNQSQDRTLEIVTRLSKEFPHLEVREINHPRESHQVLEPLAGTPTWIFAADGDEIYDPAGLGKMRSRLMSGEFAETWAIYGNVLNCTNLNIQDRSAKGYLAPPCRSMTKLYNFSLIESWVDCPERLHGGQLVFKNRAADGPRRFLHTEVSWEAADFRCLHTVFMPRSSGSQGKNHWNPVEMDILKAAPQQSFSFSRFKMALEAFLGLDWKNRKYRRGKLVQKDISAFLP